MTINKKSILDYFGVTSQEELISFMNENPFNKKVVELKELLVALEGEKNE